MNDDETEFDWRDGNGESTAISRFMGAEIERQQAWRDAAFGPATRNGEVIPVEPSPQVDAVVARLMALADREGSRTAPEATIIQGRPLAVDPGSRHHPGAEASLPVGGEVSEAFRMVRQFDLTTHEPNVYRVQTVRLMTEAEALQLMRDLGSPYKGQRYPNNPQATEGVRTFLGREISHTHLADPPGLTNSQLEQLHAHGMWGEPGPEIDIPSATLAALAVIGAATDGHNNLTAALASLSARFEAERQRDAAIRALERDAIAPPASVEGAS